MDPRHAGQSLMMAEATNKACGTQFHCNSRGFTAVTVRLEKQPELGKWLQLPGAISRLRWVIVITQAIWASEASRGCRAKLPTSMFLILMPAGTRSTVIDLQWVKTMGTAVGAFGARC